MAKRLLGLGTVTVGGVTIGLTRGGSVFNVEREFRQIEADGDYGPVEGRVEIIKEVAKLTVNALELFEPAEIIKYYPGTTLGTGASETFTSSLSIIAGDYNNVVWTGYDSAGRQVIITLENCLNLSNLDWALVDKDEAVPSLEFTATYDASARTTPPWKVDFVSGTTRTVTFTVSDTGGVVAGATVYFYNQTKTTNGSGVAAFTFIPEGVNRPFTVTKGGYATYMGAVTVDGAEAVAVTIVALA
jgi:hypothetical protein